MTLRSDPCPENRSERTLRTAPGWALWPSPIIRPAAENGRHCGATTTADSRAVRVAPHAERGWDASVMDVTEWRGDPNEATSRRVHRRNRSVRRRHGELHGRLRHRRIAARRRWRSCACCFLRRDQWRLELSVDEIRIGPGAHRITGLRDQSIQKRAGACKRTAAATSKRRQRAPWLPVAPLRCAYK